MAIPTPSRSATAADWASSNPILASNEAGLETDTGKVKVGDGVLPWLSLPLADTQETSSQLAAAVSNESGTGSVVFTNSPTITTPTITGVAKSDGNDTSSGATVTAPAVTSGVAFTPSTTKNAQVTFQLAAATGSYTLTYGPSTGAENTLASAAATLINESTLVSFMVPKGWKVVITLTTVTLTATLVTTF